tara:strand:- start:432 stop:599 length:168 start_codon:yes stop_codon:yes gene_type:complete
MMDKEKKIYYSDILDYVDVCFSCTSQNIDTSNSNKYICKDCQSEDVGSVPPEDVL